MIAAGKDGVVDMSSLTFQVFDLLVNCRNRSLAVPECIILGYFRTQRFPLSYGFIHARMSLRITFADGNPEVLILENLHLVRVPLAGNKPLGSEKVRIFIAQGDVCHAPL